MNMLRFIAVLVVVLANPILSRVAGSPPPTSQAAGASQAGTQPDQATRARIAEWIEQLGAKDFAVRKQAQAELVRIGNPAIGPLRAAAKDGDPERAYRAAQALNQVMFLTVDLGNKVTMKLLQVPAGKFMMGSPKDEKGHLDNEAPQHEVTISKPFHMGVYPVTQEQYEAVMGNNPSQFKEKLNPVEMVSWDDAVAFCKKASEKTGKTVRLPTEAEWEYACRGGSKTRFYFGDDEEQLGDFAWYNGNSGATTHPVGLKKPNAFGLYDTHGNVFEWCADWYSQDYKGNSESTDPTGPANGTHRVLRGGCIVDWRFDCRSALRRSGVPHGRLNCIGFRVVASAGEE